MTNSLKYYEMLKFALYKSSSLSTRKESDYVDHLILARVI